MNLTKRLLPALLVIGELLAFVLWSTTPSSSQSKVIPDSYLAMAKELAPDADASLTARALWTLDQRGLPAAFEQLATTRLSNTSGRDHTIAHALGQRAYSTSLSLPNTLTNCSPDFDFGCFHGAIEAFVKNSPALRPQDVKGICENPKWANWIVYECWHGLGHGLLLAFPHRALEEVLAFCTVLGPEDKALCARGVFMQRLVFLSKPDRYGPQSVKLDPKDPTGSCRDVSVEFKEYCELALPTAFWVMYGANWPTFAQLCTQLDTLMRDNCFRGLGIHIVGTTGPDRRLPLDTCRSVAKSDSDVDYCVLGALTQTVFSYDDVFEQCPKIGGSRREECYSLGGRHLGTTEGDLNKQKARCRTLPLEGQNLCLLKAQGQ